MSKDNKQVFGKDYSQAYDILYEDKDYEIECDFLEKIFRKEKVKVNKILDLGCGTGKHDVILAERGYKVTGVDKSENMLEKARLRSNDKNPSFLKGDIANFRSKEKFDAVISMFAVVGYITDNSSLAKLFANVRNNLKRGGLFIFDVWYGPAVLEGKPRKVAKEVKERGKTIIRKTIPEIDEFHQVVHINFDLIMKYQRKVIEKSKEAHTMRFFFPQELKYMLTTAGFKKVELKPFLKTKGSPTSEDWNISVIAK